MSPAPLHGLALEYMALKLILDPGVRMIGLDGDDFYIYVESLCVIS